MSFIFILDLSDCSASCKSSPFTDFYGYKYIAKFGSKKEQPEKKPKKQWNKNNNKRKKQKKLNQNNANLTDQCGWILGILDDIAVVRSVPCSTTTSPLPMPKTPL